MQMEHGTFSVPHSLTVRFQHRIHVERCHSLKMEADRQKYETARKFRENVVEIRAK